MTHLQPEPISQQRLDHQPYLHRLFFERELLQAFGYRVLFFRLDVELFGIDPTRPSRELIVGFNVVGKPDDLLYGFSLGRELAG